MESVFEMLLFVFNLTDQVHPDRAERDRTYVPGLTLNETGWPRSGRNPLDVHYERIRGEGVTKITNVIQGVRLRL